MKRGREKRGKWERKWERQKVKGKLKSKFGRIAEGGKKLSSKVKYDFWTGILYLDPWHGQKGVLIDCRNYKDNSTVDWKVGGLLYRLILTAAVAECLTTKANADLMLYTTEIQHCKNCTGTQTADSCKLLYLSTKQSQINMTDDDQCEVSNYFFGRYQTIF